jgi:hypothetical protein
MMRFRFIGDAVGGDNPPTITLGDATFALNGAAVEVSDEALRLKLRGNRHFVCADEQVSENIPAQNAESAEPAAAPKKRGRPRKVDAP